MVGRSTREPEPESRQERNNIEEKSISCGYHRVQETSPLTSAGDIYAPLIDLHVALCCSFQSLVWHSREQYLAFLHPAHLRSSLEAVLSPVRLAHSLHQHTCLSSLFERPDRSLCTGGLRRGSLPTSSTSFPKSYHAFNLFALVSFMDLLVSARAIASNLTSVRS
jgi:hypothetical protein